MSYFLGSLINNSIEVNYLTVMNTTAYQGDVLMLASTGFSELIVSLKWVMAEYFIPWELANSINQGPPFP